MREKEIEEKFRDAVKKAGGKAYKFVSPGNGGVPDRLAILPGGRIGFVELKAPGRKPTALQRVRIRELEDLGCQVMVLDDIGKIPETVEAIRRGLKTERAGLGKGGQT
ncbi:MAG: VRR-NUC domain-containing protein [Hungatella sp.]|jgi:hypothetical protein|nr:VRR-NUC domain-containing protein [Hungatella sp.]